MIQMYGQPYNKNTLKSVPPDEQARLNRVSKNNCQKLQSSKVYTLQNFSVCHKCGRLAALFHRLHHQKHRMFTICVEVVESRRKSSPNLDTTKILNELLANDKWLEQVFNLHWCIKEPLRLKLFSFLAI